MGDLHVFTEIIREFGLSWRKLMEAIGVRPHANNWYGLRDGFVTGSVRLKRIREVADALGITPGTLVDLVEAKLARRRGEEFEVDNLEALKRMAKASKDVAFAYYMELRIRGLTTPEIDEWADQHL